MKPLVIKLFILSVVLAMALGGFLWHRSILEDRGHYHFGFHNGGLARLALPVVDPYFKETILRDERARQLFDEGFSDALANTPARYPYAPLSIDPSWFASIAAPPSASSIPRAP